jgi:hypothetical protein
MHTGGRGDKGYPPSKFFAKLVNKNAIKHQEGVPSPQNFYNPYIPSLSKFGQNLTDPLPGFSNRVHLSMFMKHTRVSHCNTEVSLKSKYIRQIDTIH